MQNAYASYQFTPPIGRLSLPPSKAVHVAKEPSAHAAVVQAKLASVGAMLLSSDMSQPVSYVPGLPLFASPCPPFRCVCLPEPSGGVQPAPPFHAFTN